jgi:glycine/D-amino acid oxidase-like deaminating enzyme
MSASSRFPWRGPTPEPVAADDHLPPRVDVVVVGGGIIGATAAYFLARRGVSCLVCEKGVVGAEQSGRNWGWVRRMHRDPRELPLMIEAMRLWESFRDEAGEDTGFRRTGIAYLCDTDAALTRYDRWLRSVEGADIDTRILSTAEIEGVFRGSAGRWVGALYTPTDARAEPTLATPAWARAARRHGATIATGCAVRGIERSAGRVTAVVTERGTVSCEAVVVAAGAWSRLLLRSLDIDLPQLTVLSSVLRTEPVPDGPEPAAWGGGFAFRKRLDGGYTVANGGWSVADIVPDSFRLLRAFLPAIRAEWGNLHFRLGKRFVAEALRPRRWPLSEPSPFESTRVLDPEPSYAALSAALTSLSEAFPAFRGCRVAQCWGGRIDAMPDALPAISEIPAIAGLFVATGFSGHGFGIGPGAGHLVADLVTGAPPVADPAPFRYARFHDGTPLRPMAGAV